MAVDPKRADSSIKRTPERIVSESDASSNASSPNTPRGIKQRITDIKLSSIKSEYLPEKFPPSPEKLPRIPSFREGCFNFDRKEELARGGFGVVYRSVDKNTGIQYAQKVLEIGRMKTENMAKRQFVREINVLARCPSHPHIIQLIHSEDKFKDGEFIVTLELAPHQSVKEYYKEKIPMDESLAQLLIKQIVLGMQHLHEHDILYRDLKLSNLLVFDNNQIKIADFGISRYFDEKQESEEQQKNLTDLERTPPEIAEKSSEKKETKTPQKKGKKGKGKKQLSPEERAERKRKFLAEKKRLGKLKRSNSFLGTQYYQSPEMLERTGHGVKNDVWSLGIIAWQMLYGGMPFLLRNKKQVKSILKKDLRFPNNSTNTEECEDFIQKCLVLEGDRMSVQECLQHPWLKDVVLDFS